MKRITRNIVMAVGPHLDLENVAPFTAALENRGARLFLVECKPNSDPLRSIGSALDDAFRTEHRTTFIVAAHGLQKHGVHRADLAATKVTLTRDLFYLWKKSLPLDVFTISCGSESVTAYSHILFTGSTVVSLASHEGVFDIRDLQKMAATLNAGKGGDLSAVGLLQTLLISNPYKLEPSFSTHGGANGNLRKILAAYRQKDCLKDFSRKELTQIARGLRALDSEFDVESVQDYIRGEPIALSGGYYLGMAFCLEAEQVVWKRTAAYRPQSTPKQNQGARRVRLKVGS